MFLQQTSAGIMDLMVDMDWLFLPLSHNELLIFRLCCTKNDRSYPLVRVVSAGAIEVMFVPVRGPAAPSRFVRLQHTWAPYSIPQPSNAEIRRWDVELARFRGANRTDLVPWLGVKSRVWHWWSAFCSSFVDWGSLLPDTSATQCHKQFWL